MQLIIMDRQGKTVTLNPAEINSGTTQRMLDIFATCIELQQRKSRTYGDAYRSQGYMGNMARVLSKASRLKNMVWSDVALNDADESLEDTILDLINLATFFVINYRDGNKWGNDRR